MEKKISFEKATLILLISQKSKAIKKYSWILKKVILHSANSWGVIQF